MDLKLLTDALVIALAPVLPHLVAGGTEAAKAAGKKAGEETFELGRKLWTKLRTPVEESPRARAAAEEVAEAPEDDDARAGLRRQLVKILEADPGLASEVAKLLDSAGRGTSYQANLHGRGAIAQGPGAVAGQAAVGRDLHGNVSLIEHLNVHVQAPDAGDFLLQLGLRSPAPDLEEAAQAYLRYLVAAYQYLDLRGMGISDRVALKLPLLERYVPLQARLHTPEGETWARQLRVAGRPPAAEEGADMGERLSAPSEIRGEWEHGDTESDVGVAVVRLEPMAARTIGDSRVEKAGAAADNPKGLPAALRAPARPGRGQRRLRRPQPFREL